MKKALSILLIFAFILSMAALVACGDKDSKEEEKETRPAPDGETFELKDQDNKFTFSLQAYKDASLTYKAEEFYNRPALLVTSAAKEYSVYVYINNGYANNYESKHQSGLEDGGSDITVGDYSGYTYPSSALNAAFIDTGATPDEESHLISLVVEQPTPFTHDITEVMNDQELIDLLSTLKLISSPDKK